MSRQIQIRRGTVAQHEMFTGAPGELSFDFNTLRVHDGENPGGIILARADQIADAGIPANADYVVESQLPTAENNYTWYRKYASGWVEQGGTWSGNTSCAQGFDASISVNLPISMSDDKYHANAAVVGLFLFPAAQVKYQDSVLFRFGAYATARTLTHFTWYVCGTAVVNK